MKKNNLKLVVFSILLLGESVQSATSDVEKIVQNPTYQCSNESEETLTITHFGHQLSEIVLQKEFSQISYTAPFAKESSFAFTKYFYGLSENKFVKLVHSKQTGSGGCSRGGCSKLNDAVNAVLVVDKNETYFTCH